MSITPMPSFEPLSEGIHLSALDAYIGKPGALEGVSFWPRVGARLIDLVFHFGMGRCSGYIFGFLTILVVRATHSRPLLIALRGMHGSWIVFIFAVFGAIAMETVCEGLQRQHTRQISILDGRSAGRRHALPDAFRSGALDGLCR